METILNIFIYLAGCVLAYFRILAAFYEIDEKHIKDIKPSNDSLFIIFVSLFSWATFFVGIIIYHPGKTKYLFKLSKKKLWKQYKEQIEQSQKFNDDGF